VVPDGSDPDRIREGPNRQGSGADLGVIKTEAASNSSGDGMLPPSRLKSALIFIKHNLPTSCTSPRRRRRRLADPAFREATTQVGRSNGVLDFDNATLAVDSIV
jgi:hypothetical protein